MFRKIAAATVAATAVLALATFGVPTPSVAQQAAREAQDTTPYAAYKGGNQACNAIGYMGATEQQARTWLNEHRGFSRRDARTLVQLAVDAGCHAR